MNTITKRIRKELAAIAKRLPHFYHNDQFIRVKVGVVDKRTIQVQEQNKSVNHKKQLEKAYMTLGDLGVSQYCQHIQSLHSEAKNKAENENKTIA